MAEYGLGPDELVATAFRVMNSSREGYRPLGRREWIAAFKKVCETDHQFTAVICKTTTCGFTIRDFGLFRVG
jgi:hypothetical protein